MHNFNYPKKVTIGDITVRDGFQHEEIFIPTAAKIWVLEQSILAGFKHLEVTNFGNPKGMPQFSDADAVFKGIRNSKVVKGLMDDVKLTAVTIRERAIERATSQNLGFSSNAGCPPAGKPKIKKPSQCHRRPGLQVPLCGDEASRSRSFFPQGLDRPRC